MAKLRLIFVEKLQDAEGKSIGRNYFTKDIEVSDEMRDAELEVVGAEWLQRREPIELGHRVFRKEGN